RSRKTWRPRSRRAVAWILSGSGGVAGGPARRWSGASMALPGLHAVGDALVEARRAHDRLDASESHALAHRVAHTGESEAAPLALRLLDEVEQRVAGGGVYRVHRLCVQEHVLRGDRYSRRTGRLRDARSATRER